MGGWNNEAYDCDRCKRNGYYQQRNCRYYAGRKRIDGYRWQPVYKQKRDVTLKDPCIRECPRSFITPKSAELVRIVGGAMTASEGSGASMFGPDLSKWPAWAYDAVLTLKREENRWLDALQQKP